MINVMGEVKVPGIYRLSAFASVFHALYRAGGISDIGSLRDIRVVRDGKEIARVDVYDYIMKGKLTDNIRLSEGDVILVPPYQNLVSISGKVKRPMKYEMKSGNRSYFVELCGRFYGRCLSECHTFVSYGRKSKTGIQCGAGRLSVLSSGRW